MNQKIITVHTPVLLEETIRYLNILPDGIYLDCTGGGGGHSREILSRLNNGKLFIMDRDEEACDRLHKLFGDDTRVTIINDNFSNIKKYNLPKLNGLCADFGISSFHLNRERGFSFKNEGMLDMRMDKKTDISAYEVVNEYPEEVLANIITKFGEEPFAKKIAFNIVKSRVIKKIKTTKELADIIRNAIPRKFHKKGIDPATKTFQAIRIFVNKELESIESLLRSLEEIISINGRAVFISFHSLEDRLVKDFLTYYSKSCICPPNQPICTCGKKQTFKILTKKPVTPSKDEIIKNPFSRSAKLRAGERV
ncbi:MAG: 16S rRNA (cytosine(1402)-N(4))-methyltransferase RsmH [Deferribacterales bacterium]